MKNFRQCHPMYRRDPSPIYYLCIKRSRVSYSWDECVADLPFLGRYVHCRTHHRVCDTWPMRRLPSIGYITKCFVWACYRSKLTVPYCTTVKFGYFLFRAFLRLMVAYVIDFICTAWSVRHAFYIVYYVYDFCNKISHSADK